jgi:hypothetical protein
LEFGIWNLEFIWSAGWRMVLGPPAGGWSLEFHSLNHIEMIAIKLRNNLQK